MIAEFKAFVTAFQKGKELANSAVWKDRTLLTNNLGAFLGASAMIAGGFGYSIDVDQETLHTAAGGIAALVCIFNAVMTSVTSARVGTKGTVVKKLFPETQEDAPASPTDTTGA